MRPDQTQRAALGGGQGQFRRRFGKTHLIPGGIHIQINLERMIKARRHAVAAALRVMPRAQLGRIIEQRDFLLGVIHKPGDDAAGAQIKGLNKAVQRPRG